MHAYLSVVEPCILGQRLWKSIEPKECRDVPHYFGPGLVGIEEGRANKKRLLGGDALYGEMPTNHLFPTTTGPLLSARQRCDGTCPLVSGKAQSPSRLGPRDVARTCMCASIMSPQWPAGRLRE